MVLMILLLIEFHVVIIYPFNKYDAYISIETNFNLLMNIAR